MLSETLLYIKSPYGNIKIESYKMHENANTAFRMFLDGGLQWDSRDEHRYHQALFATPYLFINNKKKRINVLVLGGGDGLGARELLKLSNIEKITIVDINPIMTTIAKDFFVLKELNEDSLNNKKIEIINEDAYEYVQKNIDKNKKFDLIIADYPDPVNIPSPIDKLFSVEHYTSIKNILSDSGIFSLQATSVFSMPNVFRKIQLNIQKVFESQLPLRVNIHSFGDIGIILAQKKETKIWNMYKKIPQHLFFDENSFNNFINFFKDELPILKDEIIKESEIWKLMEIDLSS